MPDNLLLHFHQPLQSARAIKVLLPTEVDQLQLPTRQTAELVPLLFGLSLAVMLPPDAIIAPRGPIEPVVWAAPLARLRWAGCPTRS